MSLNPQTIATGQEQYEFFNVRHLRKNATRVQYDYRHTDGKLFSCVAKTLDDARARRDQWIEKNAA